MPEILGLAGTHSETGGGSLLDPGDGGIVLPLGGRRHVGDGVNDVNSTFLGIERSAELDVCALHALETSGGKRSSTLLDGSVLEDYTPAHAPALTSEFVESTAVLRSIFL